MRIWKRFAKDKYVDRHVLWRTCGPFLFGREHYSTHKLSIHAREFCTSPANNQPTRCDFQMDGAPAHWGLNGRAFLNARFGDRWIGIDGPTPWHPRSPDINPLDFLLWGYVWWSKTMEAAMLKFIESLNQNVVLK